MRLVFDLPLAGWVGLPLVLLVAGLLLWSRKRGGQSWPRIAATVGLRTAALLLLVGLAARPVWVARETASAGHRPVAILVDRSESMSLEEGGKTRYERALGFAREQLLPALKAAGLPAQALLFAQDAVAESGEKIVTAIPDGKRTNLGGAIAQALANATEPPLAVIALTDGMANESADNNRALTGLVDGGVPFIGVGFGSDEGVPTLTLRNVDAPPVVSPKTTFNFAAQLEAVNGGSLPEFDLLLFRDDLLLRKKTVPAGKGSRMWQESFSLSEEQEGAHRYEVRLMPPDVRGLKCVNQTAGAAVRISQDRELRVLYIQGALTWDYKFVGMALRDDPAMKLTGLTRTSKQSIFRQNVESSGELVNGFPASLTEIAPFRVIVLSNLKPADLTTEQQEMLARFVGELGGGLLMIGGAATFDSSWQGSRLEQLLPVVFASGGGVQGLDRPFRLQLSDEALQHPVFQITEHSPTREAWGRLPTFTQYGVVDAVKPGAQVWARHQQDEGPNGRRILMASQRFGAGLSAVISIQNFWRWRLAKDAEPREFDRFWRQLFRYLSEIGRQDVSIHLADQELRPGIDVRLLLERQPNPSKLNEPAQTFTVRVSDPNQKKLAEQAMELETGRSKEFTFRAEQAGVYNITVVDAHQAPVASRALELRDFNVEFENTGRSMETLSQWASVSGGLAVKQEDCRGGSELVRELRAKVEQAQRGRAVRQPAGLNGWTLAALLGCLGGEWLLRKKWGWV